MSINKVMLSGNLTRDAEQRQTQSGMAIVSFGIAVNERRQNASGEWEDYPNFFTCVLFGRRAQALYPYLSKGTKVALEGKLRYSSWTTQDNQNRSKVEIIVDEIEFLSRSNQQNGAAQNAYAQSAPQAQASPAPNYASPANAAPQAGAPAYSPAPTAAAPAPAPQPSVEAAPAPSNNAAGMASSDIPF